MIKNPLSARSYENDPIFLKEVPFFTIIKSMVVRRDYRPTLRWQAVYRLAMGLFPCLQIIV